MKKKLAIGALLCVLFTNSLSKEFDFEEKLIIAEEFVIDEMDNDSYRLDKKLEKKIVPIVETLKRNKWLMLKVEGHASTKGSEAYNLKLSKKRAESVANFLIAHGIPKDRIELDAKGELFPIADETKENGESKNRRVRIAFFNIFDKPWIPDVIGVKEGEISPEKLYITLKTRQENINYEAFIDGEPYILGSEYSENGKHRLEVRAINPKTSLKSSTYINFEVDTLPPQ